MACIVIINIFKKIFKNIDLTFINYRINKIQKNNTLYANGDILFKSSILNLEILLQYFIHL